MKITSLLTLLAAALLCMSAADRALGGMFGSGVNAFNIEFVPIGNPGNAADATGNPNPAGSVSYHYNMSKFEISEQMIDKANAEGGLGITKTLRGPDKPATHVNWFEAARFVNWLNTSQGFQAAYKFAIQPGEPGYDANTNNELWAPGDAGYDSDNLFRNSLAQYFLPSGNEWYKAAYYDPNTGAYFDHANGSDAAPTAVASGTAAGTAVYGQLSTTGPADITQAGGLSPYGTMAQGGNIGEWTETENDLLNNNTTANRMFRGGSWTAVAANLSVSQRGSFTPAKGLIDVGFRVVCIPEPSTLLLGALVGLGLLWRRQSR